MALSSGARRLALPLAVFLFGLASLGAAALLILLPREQGATPSAVGGPFALVDQDGRTRTERDFRGAPHLVFFGFTHCPDICPTTLHQASEVLRAAGDRGKALRALFVTVDPERDTPEVLKSYLGSFDPRVVGLTGTPEQVRAVEKTFRVYSRKVPLKEGDYTMEHTSLVYLMDKEGRFVGGFNLNRPPVDAAAELLRRL